MRRDPALRRGGARLSSAPDSPEETMQALIVRPVMTGLLALIIAGIWGTPLGTRGGGAAYEQACRGAAPATAPAALAAPMRRAPHC
jgi:hypothetical protein